jgi:hypothetical protein
MSSPFPPAEGRRIAVQGTVQGAQDQLVQVKVLAHSFDRDRFVAAADEGTVIADAGVTAGQRALRELRARRLGLGVSLVVILAVIAGLALKLREIERPPS